ncbi:hypothetical protein [Pseudosulfitobacter koreensis]|uniref:MYXO-CTERM domain-containing protein n=1 Tax=Pseudosulfitobacter koreensis TaxID=2968472 RepID=A0ABT1YZR9_9RHOB|nr:hypothetical protein [Pseudosulfitobacter koreense]MCR8826363.1 hypothetical protein [Pseudosulfitobacter koreense]
MRPSARNTRNRDTRSAALGIGALAILGGAAILMQRRTQPKPRPKPRRKLRRSAAIMGASMLVDSAMEHFRGGFHNKAMLAAPVLAAASTLGATARAPHMLPVHATSVAVGAAGLGFHGYNIAKRPGGFNWDNLFYAAPIGAPGGLAVTGLLALASDAHTARHGRMLAGFTALATLAETAEVALLHFRGAWHNPAMYLPVTIPPIAAALLLEQALHPNPKTRGAARGAQRLMAAMGVVGTGFHIYGVSRQMGGWHNWRQNAFDGPPVSAPSSFIALALSGKAALDLMEGAP